MNVNLKLLHTFVLVAEHCSFRRAAEESSRSQSAISMQIRQLELQLGVSLFHRTTRRVSLTREGELLLSFARKAALELEMGLRQIKEAVGVQSGHLSFACAPTVAANRLPRILASFQDKHPGVTVDVREIGHADMLEAVRRLDIDFGIGARCSNAAEFQFQPILIEDICAVIPASLDIADKDGIALVELAHRPILMLSGSAWIDEALLEARRASGVAPGSRFEVCQVQTQIAMAAAGLGIAILPRMAVSPIADPRLRVVPIVDPPMTRELCVVSLRGHALPPAAARFIALLQRMIAEPVSPWGHEDMPDRIAAKTVRDLTVVAARR